MHNHHHGPCGCRPPQHPLHVGELKYSAEQINELLDQIPKKANRSELHGLKGGFQADEEDLTERSGEIKFKDRDTSKGKGFIILRTGKSLTEQMTQENTIYEVRYDFDLNGETLEIPANCVIDFKGGCFKNGTVILNKTNLAGDVKCFCSISGTVNDGLLKVDWFIENHGEDSTEIVNQCLNIAKRVEFSPRNYNVNGSIEVPSNAQLVGNGCAINASGNVNLFNIAMNARSVLIENMTLYTEYDESKGGTAIKPNSTNGGADHIYRDLTITGFAAGIYAGEVWWNNTIENVKFTTCGVSVNIWAANGQSINNVFIKCYSNIAKKTGIILAGVKNCLFLNCNNGLSKSDSSRFVQVSANSIGVKFLGCNFEDGSVKYSGDTLFNIGSDSIVNFESCTFAALAKKDEASTSTSIIKVSNTAKVTLLDCVGLNNSIDYDLFSQNNSRIYYRNLKGMSKTFSAWTSAEESGWCSDLMLPTAGRTADVDNTVYIDTGLKRVPVVTFSLQTDKAIGATIIEALSNGTFKLRFYNLSDGSVNTNLKLATVHWFAT